MRSRLDRGAAPSLASLLARHKPRGGGPCARGLRAWTEVRPEHAGPYRVDRDAVCALRHTSGAPRRGRVNSGRMSIPRTDTRPMRTTPKRAMCPRILSVNVGRARTVIWRGRSITTGIFKEPIDHGVALSAEQLEGDEQADVESHGGLDKAVYAYGREDYAWWKAQLGRRLESGMFGENLTTDGIAASEAVIGERWRVGTAVVEVSQPRMPCYKLAMRMDDPEFVRVFAEGRRPGAYLRVVECGTVSPGDAAEVLSRPDHGVTVRDVAEIYTFDRARAPELHDLPGLAASMREWARLDCAWTALTNSPPPGRRAGRRPA